ncbi:MAG: MFS transporter [Alphaproteobacteria bacterium]
MQPNKPVSEPSGLHVATRGAAMALLILFAINLFNNLDRAILRILAEPIKQEFALTDSQLGLLNGFAFSLLYAAIGFPMAGLADRGNRSTILSVCLFACPPSPRSAGLTTNFIQLCLCRAGVGIGEAACVPASHSLISDYFPPEARTRALSIFGLGLPIGGLLGVSLGGLAMDLWGWRIAFIVIGLPGVIVALVARLVIKEPLRGRFEKTALSDPTGVEPQSYRDVIVALWKSPVARNVILGAARVLVRRRAERCLHGAVHGSKVRSRLH